MIKKIQAQLRPLAGLICATIFTASGTLGSGLNDSTKTVFFLKDSTQYVVEKIEIFGNIKTKDFVVFNELELEEGEKYNTSDLRERIEKSKANLLRTPLFHSADFRTKPDSGTIHLEIHLVERWYLWPEIIISHADQNFSNWLKNKEYLRSNLGLGLMKFNFRGRNEKISFFILGGYDEMFMSEYTGIKIDTDGKHRLGFQMRINNRKETPCCVINDTMQYYKTQTAFALRDLLYYADYAFHPNPNLKHSLRVGYRSRKISDSLLIHNPDYLTSEGTINRYLFLSYHFTYDTRDSRSYPHSGNYLNISIEKTGFQLFGNRSIAPSGYASIRYSKFSPLSNKSSLLSHISVKKDLGNSRPFFLNNALGFNNKLSGYEYYTVHGDSYIFLQQRLSTNLLKQNIQLNFIPWHQFNTVPINLYFQLFAGYGYINNSNSTYNENNTFMNTSLYSAGAGINIISYYDKLLRAEYSINHLKENSFFLSFEAAF